MIVSTEFLLPAQQPLILNAMIDNGASARGFIDRFLVKLKNIRIYKTPYCWNHGTAIVQRQAQGYAVALRPGDVT
jgi:hypothetical protein